MKNFELNNYNLSLIQKKSRLYSYLNTKLDKAYFKLSKGQFMFALCSGSGLVRTTLNVDYDGDDTYFSLDYNKWQIALQKFVGVDNLKFSLNNSLLKIYVDGSEDIINLGVISYDENSDMAHKINDFIPDRKSHIKSFNHLLTLNDELLSHFDLMNNLFTSQGRVNSIGLGKKDVVYSDRSVVVKAKLEEELPNALFTDLEEGDDYIYLHTFTLKLFEMASEFNKEVYFDNDYEIIYWGDEETDLVICSDSRTINLPTDEQFEGIKPSNRDTYIDINIDDLRSCLGFFRGFYEESAWKPLRFVLEKGKDVLVRYKHPTADVHKTILGTVSNYNSEFILDAETLGKITSKIRERLSEGEIFIRFNFDDKDVPEDDRAPGVYCTVNNNYEFIISTLLDD